MTILSCGTTTNLKFNTTPADAEVRVVDSNGISTTIGKTPFAANDLDVFKSNSKYSQIVIKKDGYVDHDLVITKPLFGADIVVNAQLKKDENMQNVGEQTIVQEKVANGIARANGLIQSKQFEEAETSMLNFVEQFPSVSVGYDYLGNINYLQKRYAKALKYYNRASALNPQNSERKVIIERIQNLVKGQQGEVQ
jgi:tetratricopeptide (TPR) repeat protein